MGDPAAVLDAVASELGVTSQPGFLITDSIAQALSGRRLLIVVELLSTCSARRRIWSRQSLPGRRTGRGTGSSRRVLRRPGPGVLGDLGRFNSGERAGTTSADAARIKELEQEVRELRRADSILWSASAFFAAEPDRPPK